MPTRGNGIGREHTLWKINSPRPATSGGPVKTPACTTKNYYMSNEEILGSNQYPISTNIYPSSSNEHGLDAYLKNGWLLPQVNVIKVQQYFMNIINLVVRSKQLLIVLINDHLKGIVTKILNSRHMENSIYAFKLTVKYCVWISVPNQGRFKTLLRLSLILDYFIRNLSSLRYYFNVKNWNSTLYTLYHAKYSLVVISAKINDFMTLRIIQRGNI